MEDKEKAAFVERVTAALNGDAQHGRVEDLGVVLQHIYETGWRRGVERTESYDNRTTRSEALGLAIEACGAGGSASSYIEYAEKFYPYLRGDVAQPVDFASFEGKADA